MHALLHPKKHSADFLGIPAEQSSNFLTAWAVGLGSEVLANTMAAIYELII